MKIAFVLDYFPKLSETFILNQITGLIDYGCDVKIFAFHNPNEEKIHHDVIKYKLLERTEYIIIPHNKVERAIKATDLVIKNINKNPYVVLNSLNIFKNRLYSLNLPYLLVYFLDEAFDIVHCHFGPNGVKCSYLKDIGIKSKLITTFYGYDVRLGIETGGKIYQKLFKNADCILAASRYLYKHLIGLGADHAKLRLHYPGINPDNFIFKYKFNKDYIKDEITILTVARLVKEKGIDYGIFAISKLIKLNPKINLKYLIVGNGPLKDYLKRIVKDLNLQNIVKFLGWMRQDEIVKLMVKSDIFLLPSVSEAFGVVLLEAQAVGLPIVATNVGGIPEAIVNGKSGFLVPKRDIDALAKRLKYLIEHPELWPKMGRFGRKIIESKYNIKKLNRQLIKVYKNLLGGLFQSIIINIKFMYY